MSRKHTDWDNCWCNPHFELPCALCCGVGEVALSECLACDGIGWVIVTRETFEASDHDGLVIHNEVRAKDVCVCCDYRHQHEDGVGKCRMPDDLSHGFVPCKEFLQ